MSYTRTLCWLRRDLRLSDHTALAEACRNGGETVLAFIFDTNILDQLPDRNDRRMTFIVRSLAELEESLRRLGSTLIVRRGDPVDEIPRLVESLDIDAVFFNRDYEPYAKRRDEEVTARLRAAGCAVHSFKDHVVFEGDEIRTGQGTPFKVFTPYRNGWMARLASDGNREATAERAPDLRRLAPARTLEEKAEQWPIERLGFTEAHLWLEPGERAAHERLKNFAATMIDYDRLRNVPEANGTSGLSAHLRFGTISTRECVRQALRTPGPGATSWLNELIWREFYQMILDQFPYVVDRAFKSEYDRIEWPGDDESFAAWCQGRTGYPIVDAAMRRFNETGWMHNRLRMVTASFLTKDLLVDPRLGEAYFARYLLDYDLAANNGGWQWSASTGCDAQPYFRIFNPTSQSEKFDPEGTFIRLGCPELSGFSRKRIHSPAGADIFEQQAAECIIGEDYPHPIVDHATQRERALRLFKSVLSERTP